MLPKGMGPRGSLEGQVPTGQCLDHLQQAHLGGFSQHLQHTPEDTGSGAGPRKVSI